MDTPSSLLFIEFSVNDQVWDQLAGQTRRMPTLESQEPQNGTHSFMDFGTLSSRT